MASKTAGPPARRAGRFAALSGLVAVLALGLGGCEQLKAIGAMVGLGGDEPTAAPTPAPGRQARPPVGPTAPPATTLAPPQRGIATAPAPAGPAAGTPAGSRPSVASASPGALAAAPAASPVGVPAAPSMVTAPAAGAPVTPAAPAATPALPVVAVNLAAPDSPSPNMPGIAAQDPPFDPAGKRDPFRPFVTSAELAERRSKEQLSPLQKLELSQLRLVAIVWGGRKNHAMVEDPGGVGYVLRVGTQVGPNGGRVARIAPDAVYVEESFRDAAGSVMTNQITLRLPANPGGKGS